MKHRFRVASRVFLAPSLAFCLSGSNFFPSYHIAVNPLLSFSCTLFSATERSQAQWNQEFPHSFYRHRGVPPERTSFPVGPTVVLPKRTKDESPNTQPKHPQRSACCQQREVLSFHRQRS